jgi:ribonucleoside-diphosphate reductase beta chain
MLDTICEPHERNEVLYQWKADEHLLARNEFIGNLYNEFQKEKSADNFAKSLVANYILEGVYFYSGFMFFYNLGRNRLMPGSVQEIRYINRDENTHLWLFRNILLELKTEEPQLFTEEKKELYRSMIKEGCEQEIRWGHYVIGDEVQGLNREMITDYIQYLGNLRCVNLGLAPIYEGHEKEPDSMLWVSQYSNANMIKTDFFEARSTAYAKSSALVDDL